MKQRAFTVSPRLAAVACAALLGGALVAAQAPQAPPQSGSLPLEPFKERGASITPAYEGWFANPDGSFSMLLGYFNRNSKQAVDIPVGPNNKIEPGPVDQGQPTYFESGRQWGVLVVKVPKDFGKKAVTWTITVNGETQAIPFTLNNPYNIAPFKEIGMLNEPPKLSFTQGGPKFTGPPMATAATLTGKVKAPVAVNVWVEDPKGRGQEEGAGRGRGEHRRSQPSRSTSSGVRGRSPSISSGCRSRPRVPRSRRTRPSASPANTCSVCRPTTSRVKAEPGSSAAGPIPTSRSPLRNNDMAHRQVRPYTV